jgi:hypothetical protein
MPPEGDRLSAAEIELLNRWIKAGADWPKQAAAPPELGELVVAERTGCTGLFDAQPTARSRHGIPGTSVNAD